MRKPKVIMFDIDGVLADFVWGLTTMAYEKYGVAPRTSNDLQSWNMTEALTKEQLSVLLKDIENSPNFWMNLPLAPNISPDELWRIGRLDMTNRVYFVTSRIESGDTLQQSRDWLRYMGITPTPNVIMSSRKGDVARAIKADYSIEDKWDNAHCIHWISDSPQTKSYLIERPYNQLLDEKVGAKGVRRIKTIKEFLDDVEEGK